MEEGPVATGSKCKAAAVIGNSRLAGRGDVKWYLGE